MSKKRRGRPKGSTNKTSLKGIPDIRRYFHKNEIPLYFISATNFNFLGADEWIKGFKFITYIECFNGLHPNVFSPKEEIPHDEFDGIEDINNYLLQHKSIVDFIRARGPGRAVFLFFDEQTEALCKELGLEVCFPSCLLYTSPSPRDGLLSRMPSSA